MQYIDSDEESVYEVSEHEFRKKVPRLTEKQYKDDLENEVVEVNPETAKKTITVLNTPSSNNNEDDVLYTGRKGEIALSDFPHCRENCVNFSFIVGKEKEYCQNCFCYVCDIPASQCQIWEEHCRASHKLPQWRQAREAQKVKQQKQDNSKPTSSTSIKEYKWTLEELLSALEQVYPREEAEPDGLNPHILLKPYQKQSLAFCIDIERTSSFHNGLHPKGGIIADEMGMGKTMVVCALILANPMHNPSTHFVKTTLVIVNNGLVQQWWDEIKNAAPGLLVQRHYVNHKCKYPLQQVDVLITTPHTSFVKQILADDIYFHRVVVDESHLMERGSQFESWCQKAHLIASIRRRHAWGVSGTPLNTIKSISEQVRFAVPDKSKYKVYSLSQYSLESMKDELKGFIIRHTKCQRINNETALSLPSYTFQTVYLYMSEDERTLYDFEMCRKGLFEDTKSFNPNDLFPNLSSACVNEYSQIEERINNSSSDNHIFNLCGLSSEAKDITVSYRSQIDACHSASIDRARQALIRLKTYHPDCPGSLDNSKINHCNCTKFKYLQDELLKTQKEDATQRIVIFAKNKETVSEICLLIKNYCYNWICHTFHNQTDGSTRQRIIKQFQENKKMNQQALVVSYKVAAVGLTLTSASRIYMFEPCTDPAVEAQAAGRIHRLGQSQDIIIKRFVFKDTIEQMFIELQDIIQHSDRNLIEFEERLIKGTMVKMPKMTPQVKELFQRYNLHRSHKRLHSVPSLNIRMPQHPYSVVRSCCFCSECGNIVPEVEVQDHDNSSNF